MATRNLLAITSLCLVVIFVPTAAQATITVDMVTVGDPGNPGEYSGQGNLKRICGAVDYTYQIGKYEITNAQYLVFLNSVAKYGDTYSLFKPDAFDPCGIYGIQRSGTGISSNPYVYSVKNNDPNWSNKPVNFVSYYDTLRFVNWLQNGQPEGNQVAGVTETGTYTFSGATTVTIPDHSTLTTPHYVLPNEDEWYKAAFYKGGDSNAGYWDYATQSDSAPDNNPPWLDTGNSVNYEDTTVGLPYYLTNVGAYTLSESAYGTYDQNGNIREWTESLLLFEEIYYAFTRGGNWSSSTQFDLQSAFRYADESVYYMEIEGFRVALVPEPLTISLFSLGYFLIMKRKKSHK